MTPDSRRAVVVGAGVIGLTTAVRLLERGAAVEVVARELTPHTTSDAAAAIWYPYLAEPRDRVLEWCAATLRALNALRGPEAGVSQVRLLELFDRPAAPPWWREVLPVFAWGDPARLPAGYVAAYDIRVPLVDTPVHMRWLLGRVRALGGTIRRGRVSSLDDLLAENPLVLNCAGLDAGTLAGDPTVVPVRGQVARLERVEGVDTALVDEAGPLGLTYVIPRPSDIVVGGTADRGRRDLAPDPAVAAAMLERARVLEPRLEGARVLSHAVGLRPVRPTVRVELEARPLGAIVHNYGHGGAGFTLAWGCAEEAATLALEPPNAPRG